MFNGVLLSQNSFTVTEKQDTFRVNFGNKYCLSAVAVLPKSLTVRLNSKVLNPSFVKFNPNENCFSLSDSLRCSIADTVVAVYKAVLVGLKKNYAKNKLVIINDELKKKVVRVAKPLSESFSNTEIFGKGMQKSGTILRGFTVGTNKDFTLNSGLRLQLSGKLAKDVEIVAALTDENTPIQPEGNSERLEELDKVFIQVKHPLAQGIFGDYQLQRNIGLFGSLNRKLQGLKGDFKFHKTKVSLSYASSRGKFNSMKIQGIDGVQGPYRLVGKNNEREIIVIAGSEKVYVDGVPMKRGENNDYTIEYSNAEITFTPKRIITSASRIYVDFEYTTRKYARTFLDATASTSLLDDKLKIQFSFTNEGDNKNRPIDFILNDKEKEILARAGNDPGKAVISGVSLAKADSNGVPKGTYTKVDTVINGQNFSYYYYAPGAANSYYNVAFSYVGEGKGDYVKESIGNFRFVGIGKGNYLPVIFLPLPETKKGGNVVLTYNPNQKLKLDFELAGSVYDKNSFSEIGNRDNSGLAGNLSLELLPVDLSLGEKKLGSVSLLYHERHVGAKYSPFDRINEVEFNRYYDVGENISAQQVLREASLKYLPLQNISFAAKYGYLAFGDFSRSNRVQGEAKVENLAGVNADFNLDYVKKGNNALRGEWMRQNGSLSFETWRVKPGVKYLFENKEEFNLSDSLLASSHKYFEIAPFLSFSFPKVFELSFSNSFRKEYFPLKGQLAEESNAILNTLSFKYLGSSKIKSTFFLTYRSKKFSNAFVSQGKVNNKSILIRMDTRMNLFKRFLNGSLYYNVVTERTAKLQKVFVRVPVGQGNYIYLGDLNNNGIADEYEFEQTDENGDYILTTLPTDKLFPTIALDANVRWRLDFSKLVQGNSIATKVLSALSTETFFRLNEKSKEEELKRIYLLQLKYFLNDSTTLRGSQIFQHDFYLFRNKRAFSLRLRFKQLKKLTQFSSGFERAFYKEKSLRVKARLLKEINNRTDLKLITDNSIAPNITNRSRMVETKEITSEFSYYPYSNVEVGFKFGSSESKDAFPQQPTIIDKNSEAVRMTLFFKGKGRLRIEFERTELNANTTANYIPFEISEGNSVGKNYLFRVNFEYKLSSNLQTSLNYWGRKKGAGKIIHNLRAEARAYF